MEQTPKRRRAYSPKFKLAVIAYTQKHSDNRARKEFGVDRKQIRDWKEKKENFQKQVNEGGSSARRRRLDGGGRKLKYKDMDEVLADWVREQREQNLPVSRNLMLMKAAELSHELGTTEFNGSARWLSRFMERHDFSLRRETTVCQKPPAMYIDMIVNFILFIRKQRVATKYDLGSIIACDETAVWLDSVSDTTIDTKGAKQIVKSTGHEKSRITVMLSAAGNGRKLKPFVLLNRKRPIKALDKFKDKLVFAFEGTSWMNDALTSKYINEVLGQSLFGRRLLVWDSFRSHISESTKAELHKMRIDSEIVPGGCTKFIQAPDVCWNKTFKAKIRELYTGWLATGDKFYTKGNNMKAPPLEVVCTWIIEAWESLSSELISKSFKTCGVTNDLSGEEDNLIHCFREGEACEGGLDLLKKKHGKLEDVFMIPKVDEEDFHNIEELELDSDDLILN